MKKFAAMYVDISDSSDQRPHALGVYDDRQSAREEIIKDMETFCKANNIELTDGMRISMHVSDKYGSIACVWNIDEVEI